MQNARVPKVIFQKEPPKSEKRSLFTAVQDPGETSRGTRPGKDSVPLLSSSPVGPAGKAPTATALALTTHEE